MDISNKIPRSVLYGGESVEKRIKFESEKGASLRDIPLSKFLKWNGKHLESTGVDPSLIEQRVMAQVISGGEFVPLWDKVVPVFTMDADKQEVPVIYYDDFKTYSSGRGRTVRKSGGFVSGIELDCSNEAGLHRVEVAFRKTWLRNSRLDFLDTALQLAGQAMYDEVLGEIITELEADVDSTMTDTMANYGNDQFKCCVKMVSLIAAKRLYPTMILINPQELYDMFILDYFIHSNYTALGAKQNIQPESGLAGYLFPNSVPIYFTPKVTAAKIICLAPQAGALGIRQELTFEDFDDVRNGEEGAVLSMQWDKKSGADATPTSNVQYAWAITSAA
jgi:hypothetical protein